MMCVVIRKLFSKKKYLLDQSTRSQVFCLVLNQNPGEKGEMRCLKRLVNMYLSFLPRFSAKL